jgi:ribonuclease P protein component
MRPPAPFTIKTRRREPGQEPVAVVVGKKIVPLATDRNRIRRRITEAFRRGSYATPPILQAVIIVRHADIPGPRALERAIFELLRQSGMLSR